MAQKRRGGGAKEPRSYAWALEFNPGDPQVEELTPQARSGLRYARELARDAEERREAPLRGKTPRKPLTVARMARDDDFSSAEIYWQIELARIELFGKELSDRAIRYRLARARMLGDLSERRCQEPGCERPLPPHATARRRYCAFHLASHSRVRRHRRRAKERSRTASTTRGSAASPGSS